MALPTLAVTPGSGQTINTLPNAGQATAASSLPVVLASDQTAVPADTVVKATATSRSGTITTANTAQVLMAANASRRGFSIQNQSSGPLWFNGIGTATADQNSFALQAGDYFESSPHHSGTGSVSIIGGTAGQAFYAREF